MKWSIQDYRARLIPYWSGNDIALVVEFKYSDAATAARGLGQIRNKAYLRALRQPCTLYLGLSLQVKDRQVDAWICDGFTDTGQTAGARHPP